MTAYDNTLEGNQTRSRPPERAAEPGDLQQQQQHRQPRASWFLRGPTGAWQTWFYYRTWRWEVLGIGMGQLLLCAGGRGLSTAMIDRDLGK